jgi:glutathione S-transferase
MANHQIRLIGTPASRVMRVIWMLTELGLSYEHDPIGARDPALKQPPYTDLNPNGKVPICVVDGFPVWESLAINLYLDRKFPSAISLVTPEEQAKGVQWSLWVTSEAEMNSFNWYLHTIGNAEADRRPDVAAECRDKMQKPLAILETALADRPYLLGKRFTTVDLNVAATLYRALWMPLEAYPRVQAWLNCCWSREAALTARRARGDKV